MVAYGGFHTLESNPSGFYMLERSLSIDQESPIFVADDGLYFVSAALRCVREIQEIIPMKCCWIVGSLRSEVKQLTQHVTA